MKKNAPRTRPISSLVSCRSLLNEADFTISPMQIRSRYKMKAISIVTPMMRWRIFVGVEFMVDCREDDSVGEPAERNQDYPNA